MEYLKNKFNELLAFLKYLYVVFILTLTLFVIIEIKHIYSIDVFPFVDTPIDNIYYDVKGGFYERV
jgi:hypothetical protein